ncbi:MAG: aldehyde dehydrogenase family protein, partial [Acidimicrobiia bacterium]|nr:aldehyde dehydrogenase family protein [Acidimicrobiia bacterium]
MTRDQIFSALGLTDHNPGVFAGSWLDPTGPTLEVTNPATGETIATVAQATPEQYDQAVAAASAAFDRWRMLPAPKRGEYIRLLGNALREKRDELGALVTLEMGKIFPEGVGEVQEMIDICDFAVGLSRQLYGLTMASERPEHRMYEQWHPLGPIGVITAFNFPVAVWSWNAAIAAVCGDTVVWKPSETTPLTAIAVTRIAHHVMAGSGYEAVFNLAVGARDVGELMVADERLPLISATGSIRMGKEVGPAVAKRLGRSILELGGNNAILVMDDADLELATRAVLFAAVGTAGQRCTSLRRLIVHEAVADKLIDRLVQAYQTVPIGDPMEDGTLMGPLVNERAVEAYLSALATARDEGGTVLTGGNRVDRPGHFVEPAIAVVGKD